MAVLMALRNEILPSIWLGNCTGNDHCIQFRPLDLGNIDLDLFLGQLLEFFLQLIHFLSAFPDYYSRTGRENGNSDQFQCPFDYDL